MKLPALLIALLAFAGGTAFAQAPAAGTYSNPPAAAAEKAPVAEKAPAKKMHKKKVSHKKAAKHAEKHASRHHATHHASAKHHHAHVASAKHRPAHVASAHHGTRTMGAGPASPATDLNAPARQHRIDQAYADWQARRR